MDKTTVDTTITIPHAPPVPAPVTDMVLTPSTDPALLDIRGTSKRWTGSIGDYASLYSVAYLACEQTKARSLGTVPMAVYRRSEGKRERVDHPLGRLLSGMANDLMTWRDLAHWITFRRDTMGVAYLWVEWSRGIPVALWPVTQAVEIDFDRSAEPGRRVRYVVRTPTRTVPAGTYFADEVVKVSTAVTRDGVYGQSLARLAARDIGLSIDLEEFYRSMLDNGNHHLGHVEVPADRMPEGALDSLRNAVDAKAGVGRAGTAPIFGYGAKWVSDTQTMRDAGVIEQQTWVLQQVCRACNVPPWMVYDSSGGGGKYENAESQRVGYATNTMTPDVCDIEMAFRPVLDAMGGADLYVKGDLNGLMRGDKAAQGQFYREMVYAGVYTRADVREKEDMNPIDGLEKPLVPCNYAVLEPDGTATVLGSGASPADGNQTGTTE